MKNIILLISILCCLLSSSSAATMMQIINTNTGKNQLVAEEIVYFDINRDITQNRISVSLWDYNNQPLGHLTVAAPKGETLMTNSMYFGIYPFGFYPDKPQLTYSMFDEPGSYGSTDNKSWFSITKVNYTAPGLYNELEIIFNDGFDNIGVLRYNIPESSTVAMVSLFTIGMLLRRR